MRKDQSKNLLPKKWNWECWLLSELEEITRDIKKVYDLLEIAVVAREKVEAWNNKTIKNQSRQAYYIIAQQLRSKIFWCIAHLIPPW